MSCEAWNKVIFSNVIETNFSTSNYSLFTSSSTSDLVQNVGMQAGVFFLLFRVNGISFTERRYFPNILFLLCSYVRHIPLSNK